MMDLDQYAQILKRLDALETILAMKEAAILIPPKEPVLKLAENLKREIYARNLRMTELARVAKVPKQSVSDWLIGTAPRDPVKVKKVAMALGMSLDQLLFGQ
jgi:Helix-turn-helix